MNYSAKKRARQNIKRRLRNRAVKSRTRTYIRAYEEALASGDRDKAAEFLKISQKLLDSSVTKKVLKKKTASRKLSRLTIAFNKANKAASAV